MVALPSQKNNYIKGAGLPSEQCYLKQSILKILSQVLNVSKFSFLRIIINFVNT